MYNVEIKITHEDEDGLIVPLVDTAFSRSSAGPLATRLEEIAFEAESKNARI